MNITKLKRKLARLIEQKDEMESKHQGNEQKFTYWGGWNLGYVRGQISILEDVIDDLEDEL